jgi:hypothetical protein
MHRALQQQLRNEFPRLYAREFQFECEDGWYALIQGLSARLAAIAEQQQAHGLDQVVARQVKQKFGALRFYADNAEIPEIRDLIRDAEMASLKVCELCGNPGGRLDRGGRLMTRCMAHQAFSVP